MKDIELLDCTLRDGGRIIECRFQNETIVGLGKQLKKGNLDIIELGFLRDNVQYQGNSTFFSSVSEANAFVNEICRGDKRKREKYVLFADFGLYDFGQLQKRTEDGISGIRFGFTKLDFQNHKEKLIREMKHTMAMGYELYLQDVNTIGYSEMELLEIIQMVNDLRPVSFGIVDTYGSMYLEDLERIWHLVNHCLDKEIAIDFHSHNNMQMSFAMAQRLIQLSSHERRLIIDATLNGMGKCAGNLNTELVVDYLARKKNYDYLLDPILDAIDRYLFPIKKDTTWGYSIPAFMAGVYKAHPNNITYLTEKYRLNSKDIKYIISAIDEKTRQRYDYDNIQKIYFHYCATKIEDETARQALKKIFERKKVLVLAPGKTVDKFYDQIYHYIQCCKPMVVSVNFIPKKISCHYLFYANTIHWEKISDRVPHNQCIVTSNIHTDIDGTFLVDYSGLLEEGNRLYDNSTIMLLNLLRGFDIEEIALAGFDGLRYDDQNYVDNSFPANRDKRKVEDINREIRQMVKQFKEKVSDKLLLHFITPSIYEE